MKQANKHPVYYKYGNLECGTNEAGVPYNENTLKLYNNAAVVSVIPAGKTNEYREFYYMMCTSRKYDDNTVTNDDTHSYTRYTTRCNVPGTE